VTIGGEAKIVVPTGTLDGLAGAMTPAPSPTVHRAGAARCVGWTARTIA
jgi:hypothetical protein